MKSRLKYGVIIFAITISFITVYAASPSDIVALDHETKDGVFTNIGGTTKVSTWTNSTTGKTYAIVTGYNDDGILIIDISDPTNIVAKDSLKDTDNVDYKLNGAFGVATWTNSTTGRNYAIATGSLDAGVQTIDITNPSDLVVLDIVVDGPVFTRLNGPIDVATWTNSTTGRNYAIVVSNSDDGVQIIDITNPSDLVAKGAAHDENNGFTILDGAQRVATWTNSTTGRNYAIVTAIDNLGNGVQIIDITNPSALVATDAEKDNFNGFTKLAGARGVDTFTIGGRNYAIVSASTEDGVQIIDITNPYDIVAKDAESDDNNGFTILNNPRDIDTFTVGDATYAIVTSVDDDGVQVIDITDPTNIVAKDTLSESDDLTYELDDAYDVKTFTINGSTYAIVASFLDNGVQMIELNTAAASTTTTTTSSNNKHLTRPTFGISHETYRPVVTEGFSFNGQTFDITDNWHTDFERQSIIIGQNNTFAAKVYAPKDLRIQEFLFGIPQIGKAQDAELGVEVYYDSVGNVDGAKIVQETDVVDAESFSGISYPSKCMPSDSNERCVTTEITLRFLEPLQYDVMAIKAIDWNGRTQITYLNEGFDISGDSLNPMVSQSIAGNVKYEGMITVTQNAKYSKYWTAEDGRVFERNDHGTFTMIPQEFTRHQDSGEPLTRMHSEYSALIQIEKTKAYLTMKKLYPDYLDEPYDKINDIVLWTEVDTTRNIDYDEMKRQELQAQELVRKMLNLDYLEYTRGTTLHNWD